MVNGLCPFWAKPRQIENCSLDDVIRYDLSATSRAKGWQILIEAVILNSSGFYLFDHKAHSIIRPQTSLRDLLPEQNGSYDRSM